MISNQKVRPLSAELQVVVLTALLMSLISRTEVISIGR